MYPLDATAYPLDATAYPLMMTTYPLHATAYPLHATAYPLHVTAYPLHVTAYPLIMTTYPLDAIAYPLHATAYPLDATAYPLDATAYPLDATAYPLHVTAYPLDATAYPLHATAYPLHVTAYPLHVTAYPLHATAYPLHATAYPLDVTAYPLHATAYPLHVTAYPLHATAYPLHVTAYPLHVTAYPLHATAYPLHVTAYPLHVTIHFILQEALKSCARKSIVRKPHVPTHTSLMENAVKDVQVSFSMYAKACGSLKDQKTKHNASSCTYLGGTYAHESVWETADNNSVYEPNFCTQCSCSDGFVSCAIRICPKQTCTRPIKIPRSCCKLSCAANDSKPYIANQTGCNSLGRYYQDKEQWHPLISSYKDKCIICVCKKSIIRCSKVRCNRINCNKRCCKKCKEPTPPPTKNPITAKPKFRRLIRYPDCYSGKHYKHSTTWTPVVADFALTCVICKCWVSGLVNALYT
ncbi:hypothetical protein QZH41_020406 [Actinostola sp. cb2023]|nr:hypothetical protein QZH41_020406 [Actinostola sp. cb2023]